MSCYIAKFKHKSFIVGKYELLKKIPVCSPGSRGRMHYNHLFSSIVGKLFTFVFLFSCLKLVGLLKFNATGMFIEWS